MKASKEESSRLEKRNNMLQDESRGLEKKNSQLQDETRGLEKKNSQLQDEVCTAINITSILLCLLNTSRNLFLNFRDNF